MILILNKTQFIIRGMIHLVVWCIDKPQKHSLKPVSINAHSSCILNPKAACQGIAYPQIKYHWQAFTEESVLFWYVCYLVTLQAMQRIWFTSMYQISFFTILNYASIVCDRHDLRIGNSFLFDAEKLDYIIQISSNFLINVLSILISWQVSSPVNIIILHHRWSHH